MNQLEFELLFRLVKNSNNLTYLMSDEEYMYKTIKSSNAYYEEGYNQGYRDGHADGRNSFFSR